jgi:hypothetical protein
MSEENQFVAICLGILVIISIIVSVKTFLINLKNAKKNSNLSKKQTLENKNGTLL